MLRQRAPLPAEGGRPAAHPSTDIGKPCGQVAEWLKAADCKSARASVRWFESSPVHHTNALFAWLRRGSDKRHEASVTKEERRRLETRRTQTRVRRAKAAVIGMLAVVMPLLLYLVTQR